MAANDLVTERLGLRDKDDFLVQSQRARPGVKQSLMELTLSTSLRINSCAISLISTISGFTPFLGTSLTIPSSDIDGAGREDSTVKHGVPDTREFVDRSGLLPSLQRQWTVHSVVRTGNVSSCEWIEGGVWRVVEVWRMVEA